MDGEPLVALGVVARPHGVRGELRVHLFNPESRLLLDVEDVVLRASDGSNARVVQVVSARPTDKAVLLTLHGVEDRDAADALRGTEVCVPRSALPPADDDEYYLVDLVGLDVYQGDRLVGRVDRIFEYPSVDCVRVVGDDGIRELPLLPQYVANVDVTARRIEATNVEELPVEPKSKKER